MRNLLLCLLLLLGAGPALAQDWREQVRYYDTALETHDLERWHTSLLSLRGEDHPAAIRYLALFFAEQLRYEGDWQPGRNPFFGRFLGRDPVGLYGGYLSKMRSFRSLKYMVDRMADEDEALADLLAASLLGRPELHAVDGELRARLARAANTGDVAGAKRYLSVLRGRFHVGDRGFIRSTVTGGKLPSAVRLEVLGSYPDYELWREILEGNPKRAHFDLDGLLAMIARGLRVEPDAARDRLAAVISGADRAEPVITAREELMKLETLGLPDLEASLRVVYQRQVRQVLEQKPLESLAKLHDSYVKLAFARAFRRDSYFRPRHQRRSWDRRIDSTRLLGLKTTVDFRDPRVLEPVETCLLLEKLISVLAGDRPEPLIGTPYHPQLFALNRGRSRRIATIAFTPRELDRQELRDEILEFNRTHPVSTEIEKQNVDLVNAYRAEYDLLPLRIDRDLITSARSHCRFQQRVGAIAHSFRDVREPFGRTPADRMVSAGYPKDHAGGENIFFGLRDPVAAFKWWRRSPGHRSNMLTPNWTEIGVGEFAAYWVQNFGTEPYAEDHHDRKRSK